MCQSYAADEALKALDGLLVHRVACLFVCTTTVLLSGGGLIAVKMTL
jgi:hypothetical protein